MAEVNDMVGSLSLEEEDGGLEIDVVDAAEEEDDLRWCMIGRVLTDKNINFLAMQVTMSGVWKPGKGVCIMELEDGRFLVQFFHEVDLERAIEGSPWSFGGGLIVWERLKEGEEPANVLLSTAPFWVQIYGLETGFRSDIVCEKIRNFIGKTLMVDKKNFIEGKKEYYHVKVLMDVRRPLRQKWRLRKPGGEWNEINFKYERLPNFCFLCEVIGHGDRTCTVVYDRPELRNLEEKPYGTWLRAPNLRTQQPAVNQWLRNSKGERLMAVANGGQTGEGNFDGIQ